MADKPCIVAIDEFQQVAKIGENGSKQMESDVVPVIYERFDGVTYYMQRIMNEMYSDTPNSVKAALPALIDKDLVTTDKGKYMLCDKFLELWICEEECW